MTFIPNNEGSFILGPTERCHPFLAGLGMFSKQQLGEPPVAFASWRMPRRDLLQPMDTEPSGDEAALPELDAGMPAGTAHWEILHEEKEQWHSAAPLAGFQCHPEHS